MPRSFLAFLIPMIHVFYYISLKGMFTNLEYIKRISCLNKRNKLHERSISIKQFWLEIIWKNGAQSQSDRVLLYMLYIYITRTDFKHHFSQLFLVRVILSRWTFHEVCFFCWDTKENLYNQNWRAIPSSVSTTYRKSINNGYCLINKMHRPFKNVLF